MCPTVIRKEGAFQRKRMKAVRRKSVKTEGKVRQSEMQEERKETMVHVVMVWKLGTR